MKRIVWIVTAILILATLGLTSCHNGADGSLSSKAYLEIKKNGTMMEKLRIIKYNWTQRQVHDLLGEPDRDSGLSSIREGRYTIDANTEAGVAFWGGDGEGIEIRLYYSDGREAETILNKYTDKTMLEKLHMIPSYWEYNTVRKEALGEPDRYEEKDGSTAMIYKVDSKTEAVISSQNGKLKIQLVYSDGRATETILDPLLEASE